MFLFVPVIVILLILTPDALVSVRSLSTRPFGFAMLLASYVLYTCMFLHATLLSWCVGWSYFTKTTCTCLLIREPVGASVRLVHPRIWFKPPVANCFASDRSKAVTPRVLTFVNCLWCLFWNWLLYNHAVFSSLLFGCVGRLCLLDVAIPDMHISLFYKFNYCTRSIKH